MQHLAESLVNVAAFLEFATDDVLNPDDAVRALEEIAHSLQGSTVEEIAALRQACAAIREQHARLGADRETLSFFDNFLVNVGLVESPPE